MTSTSRPLTVAALAVATAAATVSGAVAAPQSDPVPSPVHISATIPSKQFHVQPRDPNFGKDEVLSYNPVSGELSPLRGAFDVRNTDGSVHASIEGGPASLSNRSDAIPLTTTFNGVELTATPQEVVNDGESTPGTQADMVIAAAKPADTQTGLYTAGFTVIFDAVPRG
ncbi:CS1 type fimbrial major subunit [Streptomyces sp. NPDC058405]|uniref:CS1 type fimbrial major subunit n=1 Tax=Streptomyces sp. NPDC058405 TaxID=3346482 RepID=UPI0036562D05